MVIAYFVLISLVGGAILGIGLRIWDELVEKYKAKKMTNKDDENLN